MAACVARPASVARPAIRFGVIADVQYCDITNGWNFTRTKERCYRAALNALRQAVPVWNEASVDFIIQLGDIIDGQCKGRGETESAWDACQQLFSGCSCEIYHCIGNHELYAERTLSEL